MPRRNALGGYEDLQGHPRDQYEQFHWGRSPRRTSVVEARHMRVAQALVDLGSLRRLYFVDGWQLRPRRPYPRVTVGARDGRIYLVGGSTADMARAKEWGAPGSRREVARIDYLASKGQSHKGVYWYHDHEPTFPVLRIARDGFPVYEGGDYRVTDAGIVG